MESDRLPSNIKVVADFAAAVIFCGLYAFYIRASQEAIEEAIRLYGHNVDSWIWESVAAWWYFAPGAGLFALAALALFYRWRHARFIHGVAWGWVVLPVAATAILWLGSRVAA